MKHKLVWLMPLGLLLYTVFSYTQVDPNLVLSSYPWYWRLQNQMWQWSADNRLALSVIYASAIVTMFIGYAGLLRQLSTTQIQKSSLMWLVGVSIIILFVSYPALSHDIFNYIFNAKMVLLYQANPHVDVALNFPNDPWLSFMHNTHTPAPYGYGWTVISLIPGFVGQNHLKLTIILFRLMMSISLLLLAVVQFRLVDKKHQPLVYAFLLNPLVLIETVSNIHNDVVMMLLLFLAIASFRKASSQKALVWVAFGGMLFLASVSIKFASVMFVAGLVLEKIVTLVGRKLSFGGAQSISMFLPLLTSRSQRFLPWYLIWNMSFLAFTQEKIIRHTAIWFTFSGLLSYIPYLYFGEYSPQILWYRTLILFSFPTLYVLYIIIQVVRRHESQ